MALKKPAVELILLGAGLVGKALLEQVSLYQKRISTQHPWPILNQLSRFPERLILRAVVRSRETIFNEAPDGISIDAFLNVLSSGDKQSAQENWQCIETDLNRLLTDILPTVLNPERVSSEGQASRNFLLVDCTDSQDIADLVMRYVQAGGHACMANKKGVAGPAFLDLMQKSRPESRGLMGIEATVCAGLPLISTLVRLQSTGDRILKIEGVFSGTLSYCFNTYSPAKSTGSNALKFSDVVLDAKRRGFTEPDPRDDLNGQDVGRKCLILSRLCAPLCQTEPEIHSLIPDHLSPRTVPNTQNFLERLSEMDSELAAKKEAAMQRGNVLRYVGEMDLSQPQSPKCRIALKEFPLDHPFSALQGSDNSVAIYSTRYSKQPLIIQGAGAGAHVTAQGVLNDILAVSEWI